jgi:ATP-binding cassette subfamily B protein
MIDMHKSLLKFVLHFLKPYKWWVIAFVMCASISGSWDIINALLLKSIINTVAENPLNSNIGTLLLWPAVFFLINFQVHDLTWRGITFVNYHIQPAIKNDISTYTFKYMCKQSHQYFQDNFAGQIASNINILASNIEKAANEISMHILRGIVVVIGSLIAMYLVNPLFGIALFIWTSIFCIVSLIYSKRIMNLSDNYAESESKVSGVVVDAISNAQSIRLFAQTDYEVSHLTKSLLILKTRFKNKLWYELKLTLLQGISLTLLLGFMLYTLTRLRASGLVSVGDFALIISLTIDVGWTVWWVTEQVNHLNDAIGRAKQSLNKLFVQHAIQDASDATTLNVTAGKIVFDKVHFKYHGTESLFENKSVIIEPGQKIGLVGFSGGGKTTFVNLILRLYEINSGQILIDGQNINNVTQDSLHSAVAMIPQDPALFHRSIMDNIRYGHIDATDEEVIEAAKQSHAHDFIVKLPQRYESLVGERGVKLSGGQRQRIAIARAILKNSRILILDEATSQLDSITEQDIQESLWQLMQDKTTIVVAHRLSTLMHMDRILVFDKGKIVEDGTHNELLAKGGAFKKLWDTQVGGYIIDQNDTENSESYEQ